MEIPISERQFTALAKISGIGAGTKTHEAVKLFFTQGMPISQACDKAGCAVSVASSARRKMLLVHPSIPGRIALLQEAMGQ